MKKICAIAVSTIFLISLEAQIPVAYYRLDGNVNDASPNGNHGTVINGAAPGVDRFNNPNGDYIFNGTDQYLDVPHSSSLQITGTVTIMAWAKRNSNSGVDVILEKGGDWTVGNCNYGIALHPANNYMFYFFFNGGWRGTDGVNDLNWHHYAVVASNGSADPLLYIDGVQRTVLYSSGPGNISLFASTFNLHIGAQVGAFNYYGQNSIDDVKIFNVSLSSSQVLNEYYQGNKRPGSGHAVSFNGGYMTSNTAGYNGIQTYTVEFWLKSNAGNPASHLWESNGGPTGGQSAPSLESSSNNSLLYYVGGAATISTGTLTQGEWYHIACVYDHSGAGLQQLYVNGVLAGSNSVLVTDALGPNIGFMARVFDMSAGARYYNGELDEVRIWNIALTQTQIRSHMCSKIQPTDANYSNLVAYYRFDLNNNGTVVNDLKGVNPASLFNGTSFVTSGAALGYESNFDYSLNPTASLSYASSDNITAIATSGSATGMHIYSVDDRPNTINNAPGIGGNNRYFGIFMIGGTSPQYTITYNYSGNPYITTLNENSLALYTRAGNAASNWNNTGATLNTPTQTLTATGQALQNADFIIGSTATPLPVTLFDFTAKKTGVSVELKWKTSSEINNLGFEVQRSGNGISFSAIGWVNGIGTSNSPNDYSFLDATPLKGRNFYRLKQMDIDGHFKLSPVRKIDLENPVDLTIYPNPAKDVINIQLGEKAVTIKFMDMQGRLLWQKENASNSLFIAVPVETLAKGMYIIKVADAGGNIQTQKFIKE